MAKDEVFEDHKGREYTHVDIYPGKGGRGTKPVSRAVPIHGHNDAEQIGPAIAEHGRADFGDYVAVPAGSKPPGAFRKSRHAG